MFAFCALGLSRHRLSTVTHHTSLSGAESPQDDSFKCKPNLEGPSVQLPDARTLNFLPKSSQTVSRFFFEKFFFSKRLFYTLADILLCPLKQGCSLHLPWIYVRYQEWLCFFNFGPGGCQHVSSLSISSYYFIPFMLILHKFSRWLFLFSLFWSN